MILGLRTKMKTLFPMYIHTTVHLSLCSHGVYTVHNQSMLEMPMVASAVTLLAVQASYASVLGEPSLGSGLQGIEVRSLVGPWSGQGLSEALPEPGHGGICSKQALQFCASVVWRVGAGQRHGRLSM